jgi:hypothetical protein
VRDAGTSRSQGGHRRGVVYDPAVQICIFE